MSDHPSSPQPLSARHQSGESPADLRAVAVEAAQAGAEVLRGLFGSSHLEPELKAKNDYVTRADRESEAVVLEVIRGHHPEHRVLAEESGRLAGDDDIEWVIDPLDGTTNFMQGLPVFCVSVAAHRRGELLAGAVVDPLGERTFAAARGCGATLDDEPMAVSRHPGLDGAFLATGYPFRAHAALDRYLGAFKEVFQQARAIRRCGAAALDLAHTAAGVYDGFFEFRLAPWDIAAGLLLIQEAGGRASDLDGTFRCLETGNVVAGGAAVQRELRAAVGRHADEAALASVTPVTPTLDESVSAVLHVGVGED